MNKFRDDLTKIAEKFGLTCDDLLRKIEAGMVVILHAMEKAPNATYALPGAQMLVFIKLATAGLDLAQGGLDSSLKEKASGILPSPEGGKDDTCVCEYCLAEYPLRSLDLSRPAREFEEAVARLSDDGTS